MSASQVAFPSNVLATQHEQVTLEVISRLRDFQAALRLCVDVSGRDDKAVYMDLGIDAGTWSRIFHTSTQPAHFPHQKLEALMDCCGNDIPLQWLAWRRGKGLHLLESESQRLMREKDQQIRELEKQLDWTKQLVRGG